MGCGHTPGPYRTVLAGEEVRSFGGRQFRWLLESTRGATQRRGRRLSATRDRGRFHSRRRACARSAPALRGRCALRVLPTADRESVETQHGEGRKSENAEKDPGGHLGEIRRERPRRGCRSLPDCRKADQRSVREQAGLNSRLHVHEQLRGVCLLCRGPSHEEERRHRTSFRR